ncbi:fibroin heavy chain isoform X2 [Betta splendens]|uniref:Fibroin heavy chain isoform X2 n=1 Tax=Betta splendens TaxID=158456 RepID=A0A9W2XZE7_BETSP|nr:fibroin heavy chain isoform X2 [Betta splendens]
MLVQALLQTSLVLWLVHQSLQGGVGVKPQSVSWGRGLPARAVGVGVKPGVTGALGALGSRYGSKAMKTGIGRYPAAHLGVGGYRGLGLGGRAGLRQGTPGAYGASLGTGMALGAGLSNGLGLGQAGKRVYGAGLGSLPGYGPFAGIGYPGARPGASAADLGGPELAGLGQAVQDLKRQKSRALGSLFGRGGVRELSRPELQVESRNPVVVPANPASSGPLDASRVEEGDGYDPAVLKRKSSTRHGATLTAGGLQQQLPLKSPNMRGLTPGPSQAKSAKDYESSLGPNHQTPSCGSASDLSDALENSRHGILGLDTQEPQRLVPPVSKDSKYLQGKTTYPLPGAQTHEARSLISSLPLGQGARSYLLAAEDKQRVKDLGLVPEDRNGLRIRGSVAVEKRSRGSVSLQVQGRRNSGPSGSQGLGTVSVGGQEAEGFTAGGEEAKHLPHAERDVIEPKARGLPLQTGRSNQATSYIGGAGSYLGAALGAGGYGTGLGQGAYLGGAAGKLGAAAALGQGGYPQGAAGISNGYGDGTTGYLGAVAGNGFGGDAGAKTLSTGYGNGYSDGYGVALSTGGYAGHLQGAYGALGAGLESAGGKYGGGALQVPYGSAPVIPTGLEGDGGYPYASHQLSLGAEGAKTASKYGYGAQLGATQDVVGEQAGKYGGVNGALGNGYKG